ncbi:MAG: hypothetical protein WCK82_03340 [Bacteroidota bacterium]
MVDTYTATTIQSDFFIPSSPYYHGGDDDVEVDRMMDQAMVFVSVQNNPVRKYSIPVTPLAKENKKKSENFFKRLFKTITESVRPKKT